MRACKWNLLSLKLCFLIFRILGSAFHLFAAPFKGASTKLVTILDTDYSCWKATELVKGMRTSMTALYPRKKCNSCCWLNGGRRHNGVTKGEQHVRHCRDQNAVCKWPLLVTNGTIPGSNGNAQECSCALLLLSGMTLIVNGKGCLHGALWNLQYLSCHPFSNATDSTILNPS